MVAVEQGQHVTKSLPLSNPSRRVECNGFASMRFILGLGFIFALVVAVGCKQNPTEVSSSSEGTAEITEADAPKDASALADAKPAAQDTVSESSDSAAELPPEANVATEEERNQELGKGWPTPQTVLFISGEQHGYIEPCGCTGLENQKGGLIRRDTLMTQLRDKGWDLIPIDAGNQVRRIPRQSVIKFSTTAEALKEMGYEAITFGPDDLKLPSVELLQIAGHEESNPSMFVSANVTIFDESYSQRFRIIERGGRKIGVTGILGSKYHNEFKESDELIIEDSVESLLPVIQELQEQKCDYIVLLSQSQREEAEEVAKKVAGIDLVIYPGYGEPTMKPQTVDGCDSIFVQTGVKGMYAGILGLFDDPENPVRYQRIAISSQFEDSKRMLERFAAYQMQLKDEGFDAIGASVSKNTRGQYVGSEACGDCHTTAYEIWENSPHVHATESIVAADNDRGGIPRHYDPECVSCHATGWNTEHHYPYETGFLSPETTPLLVGSGCENCHGPGKAHVDAENGDVDVDNETLVKLQQQMVVTIEEMKTNPKTGCIRCHDLDNSPDFHPVDKNFDRFWEKVKHYGKD